MNFRILVCILVFCGATSNLHAQKVKRKGVTPKEITKKAPVALFTIRQLNGKWQEVKRFPANSKEAVAFSDTLLLQFKDGNVEIKDATSMRMSMKGEAQIDAPNILTVAGDEYSIQSLDKSKLVIKDGEFTRELQSKESFYYETVGKLKVEKDSFTRPVVINIHDIKGRWLIYSRQAVPGTVTDQTALIKSVNILTVADDGTGTGEVVFYTKDVSQSQACTFSVKDGNFQIICEKYTWNYYSYKADGNEFVFGEIGKLIYYAKQ